MQKLGFVVSVCAVLMGATPACAAPSYWKALAANQDGLFFFSAPKGSKAEAVEQAQSLCKDVDGSPCSYIVSARMGEYLIGIYCSNGYDDGYYAGSSKVGVDDALAALIEGDAAWFEPQMCTVAVRSGPITSWPQ